MLLDKIQTQLDFHQRNLKEKTRQEWIEVLEKIRNEELLGAMEQAEEMNINYVTYKKLVDPSIPPLSMTVLRKVRDYIESKNEEE